MKVNFIKTEFGVLSPASESDADAMRHIKSGAIVEVNIDLSINQLLHRKIFKLLSFCFKHWTCHNENMSQKKQFDEFRKLMTIKAGFYSERHYSDGAVSVTADSLSFNSGTDFSELYSSLLNVAMSEIFVNVNEEARKKLYKFL